MVTGTGMEPNLSSNLKKLLIFIGRPLYLALITSVNFLFFLAFTVSSILHYLKSFTLRQQKQLPKKLERQQQILSSSLDELSSSVKSNLKHIKHSVITQFPKLSAKFSLRTFPFPKFTFPKTASLNSRLRIKKLLVPPVIIATILLMPIIFFYLTFLKDLPNPNTLSTRNQPQTTKILARDGTLLFKIYQDQNRTLIPLSDIPESLKLATIAIEDKNFYSHGGFSYRGILRAIRRNLSDQKLQGGSTITQQLVKNALLSPEKTLARKIREISLSILVELKFSKDEILEMYFNEVPYGGTTYGSEEASQMFFGKSVKDINLSEAALLAGLPAAPTSYSPVGAQPELAKIRQAEVLRRMYEEGFITAIQSETAKSQPLHFAPQTTNIIAPHFVMYIKSLLVQKYGEQQVIHGGLEVTTSLDPSIQKTTQQIVSQEIESLTRLNISNGAALVINPKTGEILAMVGSKDYFDFENDGQVNVTLRPRQPGSAIKPVNYALALENGFTPATVIPDTPICYQIPGQPPYCPRNYDNRFHGNVTLRSALANSYNVPAVKTLSIHGVSNMIKKGQQMGITTWEDPSRLGLSLTLGGGEVKMLDLAVVYGTLANQGIRVDLQPIIKVTNAKGKILEQFTCKTGFSQLPDTSPNPPNQSNISTVQAASDTDICSSNQVLSPNIAYQLNSILSDNIARAPAFGLQSVLTVPNHQVAVKTGTTQNLRDNWTIGYTSDFVVATWVGNNDNSPMSYVASGITGASPIWRSIIDSLLTNQPSHSFPQPPELVKVNVCTLTGQLACQGCPSKVEYFVPGTQPKSACTPEQIQSLKQKLQEDRENRDQILTGTSTEQ